MYYGEGQSVKYPNFKATGIPPSALGDSTAAAVTSSAAELNILHGVTSNKDELNLLDGTDRVVRVAVVNLGTTATAGGVFAWTPGAAAIIQRVFLDVTTKTTAACTVDVGVAANATTSADTLIDGVDVGTAAGLFDNITNKGTNGKERQRCGATQYVTGSQASGAIAGIVGKAYIEYILI